MSLTTEQVLTPPVDLPPDLKVYGLEQAHREDSADEALYPESPIVRGRELGYGPDAKAGELAIDYASHILSKEPRDLAVLSDRWSSSVVLEDTTSSGTDDKVYKVFRQSTHYGYVENEMAALTYLHNLSLAPKPYLLIDADIQYRATDGVSGHQYFAGTPIIRQNLGGDLPIIVMDKVDTAPLDTMSDEQMAKEFMRVVATGAEHRLSFGDTELVYDQKKQCVTFIDLGGVGRFDAASLRYRHTKDGNVIDMYPSSTDEELATARVAADVLAHFLTGRENPLNFETTLTFIKQRGLEALCTPLLYRMRNTPQMPENNPPNYWQPTNRAA